MIILSYVLLSHGKLLSFRNLTSQNRVVLGFRVRVDHLSALGHQTIVEVAHAALVLLQAVCGL